MSGKCSVLAHVKTPSGEIVESRLYNDLLRYSPSRALAKEYYAVGTNEKVLEQIRGAASFDENGEITFKSLVQLTGLKIDQPSFIKGLNKEVGAGIFDYDEAMTRMASFNRNSKYKNSYMATIKLTSNGKYELSVVKRTNEEQSALNKVIANQTLQNKLKYHLAKAGVSVKFMEMDEKVRGKYSTENAQKTAKGLYQLIEIATGGPHIDETMAEETGHFAVAALGDSPLVKRLEKLLTPEVQKKVFSKEELDNKILGESSRREAAGMLVGNALIGKLENRTPWENLAYRIANLAKRVFATITKDKILKAALEVESIAREIAEGFISEDFEGSVDTALATKETLYDALYSNNVRAYRTTVNKLRKLAREIGAINNELFDKFNRIVGQVEHNRYVDAGGIFADATALEGITEAIVQLNDLLINDIPAMLDSVKKEDTEDYLTRMPKHANTLKVVSSYIETVRAIVDNLQNFQLSGDTASLLDDNGKLVTYKVKEIASKLASAVLYAENCPAEVLKQKSFALFLTFLEQVHGKDYVARASRIVMHPRKVAIFDENGNPIYKRNKDGSIKKDKRGNPIQKTKISILEKIKATDIEKGEGKLSTYLIALDNDIGFFERFFASMSNNSDIIGQLADKVVKHANQEADRLSRKDWETLRELEFKFKELKKKGLISDTREIYEVDAEGKLTGNFRSIYRYGEWEDAYEEFKEAKKQEFRETHNLSQKSDFEIGVMFESYFRPLVKQWHDHNSLLVNDPDTGEFRRVPNYKYRDKSWDSLPEEVKSFIEEIRQFKIDIDGRIGHLHTVPHRAPQLRGTYIDRVKNRMSNESLGKASLSAAWDSIRLSFVEDSLDTDYGSEATYYSETEQLVPNKSDMDYERINSVPMYGIRKFEKGKRDQISTDVFQSLLAYSAMANKCAALNTISDMLSLGQDVIYNRSIAGKTERERSKENASWRNKEGTSRAYKRYTKFLDKQVYGINVYKIKNQLSIGVNNILKLCTRIASTVYLGGNVHGGMVNIGTGSIEVFKEAFAGEYFNMSALWFAHKEYFKDLPDHLVNLGKDIPNGKTSLFIQYFDVLNTNQQEMMTWHTRRPWIVNFFGNSLYLPYKSGEHYMHVIPYIALAKSTKLYDRNKKETSLWDALQLENLDFSKKENRLGYSQTYFKDPEDIDKYDFIIDITTQIQNVLNISSSSPFGAVLNFNEEQKKYLADRGLKYSSPEDMRNTITKLKEESDKLKWTDDDEIAFKAKAQEICIRMHGIYNNADKIAIQQEWWGDMLTSMKGYALGLFERRFGSVKYNTALAGETGGSLLDVATVILSTFDNVNTESSILENSKIILNDLYFTARALLFPFGEKTKQMMLEKGYSMHQFRNMRRNFGDFAFISLLLLLKTLTAPSKGDDDEEDEYLKELTYYFSSRLLGEQMAYNTIRGAAKEYNNLTTLMPIGFSVLWDLWDLIDMATVPSDIEPQNRRLTGDELPEDYTKYYYNAKKEGIYDYGDSKAKERLYKMLPYVKSFKSGGPLIDPYEAYESYEYGQKIKTK